MLRSRFILVLAALSALGLVGPAAAAAAEVQPYQANDFKGFRDVLPPGANGLVNAPQLAGFLSTGAHPANSDNQLGMYGDLVYATPGLKAQDVPRYFKDSSFGVKPDDVARTYSPRGDVKIVRDRSFGVPHVYGDTRAGAMFGLGYIAAEDRLFFIDVLRHVGRGELTPFAGGAKGNRDFEAEQWAAAPYTEADLQRQIDQFDDLYGAEGAQIQSDVENYTLGINQYISEAKLDLGKMPAEYAAINKPAGPDAWKQTDIIATAALVGGIFGKGGGKELQQVKLLRSFTDRFGQRRGRKLWYQFSGYDDPDAPTTIKRGNGTFNYQRPPKRIAKGGEVFPDRGSLEELKTVAATTGAGSSTRTTPAAGPLDGLLAVPKAQSNALLVSAKKSATGRPLAVFGPQTGYFAPQILMEEDVHAPGIDARGASFPGVNLYVQLGRGRDYAWSATSAGQDIVDTFQLPLCEPDGKPATLRSMSYSYRGQCLPIEVLEKTNSWTPTAADMTPAGSQTLRAERTKLGLVQGRATVGGTPSLFTSLRATYFHEVDSARGFSDFADPAKINNARDYQRAADKISYTFNWLYADDKDIAYFNSGANPIRQRGTTGQLPMASTREWKGYDPERNLTPSTPFAQKPQIVNQDYITSWNNRQAAGFAGADDNLYSSVYRSQMLDVQLDQRLKRGHKLTLPGLIDAMEEGGTTDLRGLKPMPMALRILGTPKDPTLAAAVTRLRAWERSGAHRKDGNRDGAYDDAEAVRIMDAWWPRLLKAEFEPVMGKALFDELEATHEIDNNPNNHGDHLGSAYQTGWYGYAYKDLRRVLKRPVRQKYARVFCGRGNRTRCRTALEGSLREALGVSDTDLYGKDETCQGKAGTALQFCFDAVLQRPIGAVSQPLIHWINRPTYQQAVEIEGHRPR